MTLFLLTCLDHEGTLDKRMATRPAHLDYVDTFGSSVKLAGPVLNAPDGGPIGSHFILDVVPRGGGEFVGGYPRGATGIGSHQEALSSRTASADPGPCAAKFHKVPALRLRSGGDDKVHLHTPLPRRDSHLTGVTLITCSASCRTRARVQTKGT